MLYCTYSTILLANFENTFPTRNMLFNSVILMTKTLPRGETCGKICYFDLFIKGDDSAFPGVGQK
jgi:hypothetical protein